MNAEKENEKKLFGFSVFMAFLLCLPFTITFIFSDYFQWLRGIYPLSLEGLVGIFTAPLIHSDWTHFAGNISALLILFIVILNNFHPISWKIFLISYIVPGLWTWLFAREAWHVGASMIVYSLASFVFFAGVFSNHIKLVALSLFVVFMYGGIFFGIFPIKPEVSWEGHLSGFILGIVLAIYYKNDVKKLYPKQIYFEDEEDSDNDENADDKTNLEDNVE